MASHELSLSGGEIAVIKALGTSGNAVAGEALVERMNVLEDAEIIDTLLGLIAQDYVESDRSSFRSIEDVKRAAFKTNAQHVKDLRAALSPQRKEREKRRRRS